jgi:hypothetical protein
MLPTYQTSVTYIYADELTEGDIIKHFTGDIWQVYSKPEYTISGIEFEVLNLSTNGRESQRVSFNPRWRFELVGYEYGDHQMELIAA